MNLFLQSLTQKRGLGKEFFHLPMKSKTEAQVINTSLLPRVFVHCVARQRRYRNFTIYA